PAVLVASADRARDLLGWKPDHPDLAEIITDAWTFLADE
ncbi:MAG: UDP-glucose 4-epimerase GalE, partial [Streptomycetaceae bacterium]|nr:UDP-glucose 4-epimerase GalE [Streptomycetaceae bacterium]